MATQLLSHARRIALAGITGITGLVTFKAYSDPVQLFWDLDHTILCSICPLSEELDKPSSSSKDTPSFFPILSPPQLEHFDQIDDDFPYEDSLPNTRTYFRPGAQIALQFCSYFAIMHVYTAAQKSYTNNILKELDPDRTLLNKVLHRDEYTSIVKEGKDLRFALDSNQMHRAILFDDKVDNFKPQGYENGIGVKPYNARTVYQSLHGKNEEKWEVYLTEMKEMARLVGISLWSSIHFSGDVRRVVKWICWANDK